jgi:hypothetical protein
MNINRYLRIKRENQTFFVMCSPSHTIKYLKDQVALATKHEYETDQMRLLLPIDSTILNDDDKLETHQDQIKNESELYLVLKISDDEWEPVKVVEDPTVGESS